MLGNLADSTLKWDPLNPGVRCTRSRWCMLVTWDHLFDTRAAKGPEMFYQIVEMSLNNRNSNELSWLTFWKTCHSSNVLVRGRMKISRNNQLWDMWRISNEEEKIYIYIFCNAMSCLLSVFLVQVPKKWRWTVDGCIMFFWHGYLQQQKNKSIRLCSKQRLLLQLQLDQRVRHSLTLNLTKNT